VTLAIHQPGHDAIDHGRRLRLLLLDGGQGLATQALQFLVRERGVEQHIRVQVQRLREPARERVHVEIRAIQRGTDRDGRAQRFGTVRDFQRAASPGALLDHQHGKPRRARLGLRIGGESGIGHEREIHHRRGVALHHDQFQAVGKPGAREAG
jgi:hypothetical protein